MSEYSAGLPITSTSSTMSTARNKSSKKSAKRASATDKAEREQPGLRTLVQTRLTHDVFQYCSDNFNGWMVLVVDKKAMRAISASIGMYDIMERKVTLVEDIEKKRAPFRDMGAIYILAPTEDSVSRLIADYETGSKQPPLYGDAVFIFFIGRLPEKQLERIKACKPLVKRVKALSEANVDFLAKESRAFHLDMRKAFHDVYVRKGRSKIEARMADKLVCVMATLHEYPHIRYASESPSAGTLAKTLDVKLNQFLKNPEFWFHGDAQHTDRERATLLILDRKDDFLSPVMHDFTYQSMVNDLLSVKDDKITLISDAADADDDNYYDDDYDDDTEEKAAEKAAEAAKNAKDILLNEDDAIWVELRGKHIAQVIATLSDRCREMVNSDTSGFTNKQKGKTMSMSQMASALKALPEYREVMSKLSQHMQIAHQCMDKFHTLNLLTLAELEQTLSTGTTEDGAKPSLSDLMEQVIKTLKTFKDKDSRSRFRLLLITILSQGGVKEEYKSQIWKAARVSKEQDKVLEILSSQLDIPVVNNGEGGAGNRLTKLFGDKVQRSGNVDLDSEFANSRYVPPLRLILEELLQNKLSTEAYPAVRELPESHGAGGGGASARKRVEGSARRGGATSRWQRSNFSTKEDSKDQSYQGGRVIVFYIGGMSYSELRVAREVMAKESKEVVAGSTFFTRPDDFVDDIRRLAKASSGKD